MSITNILLFIIILFLAGYCLRLKLRQRPETDHSLTFEGLDLQVSNNDVMQFVRDMSENFRPAMESRNITFDVTCNPESMMGWIGQQAAPSWLTSTHRSQSICGYVISILRAP